MGPRNFLDQAVRAQQSEVASDAGRHLTLTTRVRLDVRGSHVAIAEPVDEEFAADDDSQQARLLGGLIGRRAR